MALSEVLAQLIHSDSCICFGADVSHLIMHEMKQIVTGLYTS